MIDLHLHLDGSLSAEEILDLAARSGTALPRQNAASLLPLLQVEPDCRDLGEYLQKFDLPLQVLQTEETLSRSVSCLVKRLALQGLCYAEIRFAPQLHLARGLTQQQVVAAAVDGLQKGITESGIPAQLILCCMRSDTNGAANLETVRTAKTFLGSGVCAIDLAGNEAAFPTKDFAPVFNLAKALGIPCVIHAGEAAGPESVREALALGARRIGHGIHSIDDPTLLAMLAEIRIPLETCFTSNLQTRAVTAPEHYPLGEYLRQGVPVTVNTDNMTVSGTDLRREYLLLRQLDFSEDMLRSIACSAADAAFVTPIEAAKLKEQINARFSLWLNPERSF